MRRFLFVGVTMAAGCLGPRADLSSFFLLSSPPTLSQGAPVPVVLGIGPITLPGYLDRPQIVVRLSENEIELTESDRWAEPLAQNLARALEEDLLQLMPSSAYVDYPWYASAAPDYGISLDVRRFEADSDGVVVLDATWKLTADGDLLESRATLIEEPSGSPDRAATVAAQSRALAELSQEIA
jgi:uncharacterized lipoprotein YmbA